MSTSHQERGFGLIIIIVLVAIAIGAGVLAYTTRARLSVRPTPTSTATPIASAVNAALTPTPTATPSMSYTAAQALTKVQEFYTAYSKNSSEAVAKPYLADDYIGTLFSQKAFDPVLCTQGGSDQPLRYAISSSDATTANIQIRQLYTGNNQDNIIDVSIRLRDLRVNQITCHI